MIILLAFLRTLALGLSCLLVGLIVHTLLTWGSRQAGFTLSPQFDTLRLVGCLLGAWLVYRLFFRQVWEKKEEEWVQK